MRNLLDSQGFIAQTERILSESIVTTFSTEVLSRITPSGLGYEFENSYKLKDVSKCNLTVLSLLSWYLPEDLGILLRLDIEEKIRKTDLDYLGLLLKSKGQTLCFLVETGLWSTRDWFGNILTKKNIEHCLRCIGIRRKTKRAPKRIQRHRGYRDKGTLRKESDKHDLWISTAEQMNLEEKRLSISDTFNFIVGWIT